MADAKNVTSENLFVDEKDGSSVGKEEELYSNDWSVVPVISNEKPSLISAASNFITVKEALHHLRCRSIPRELLVSRGEKNKLSEVLRWLRSNPPKLDASLQSEADFIYSLSQSSLDWNDGVQARMLQTIYRKLTGAILDCPQIGTHWQLIGFQGTDPGTDLRAVGLFGLIQLLYLTSEQTLPLARKLYKVSNSLHQPFPLAVLSLNVTNIAINVFNSEKLNRECVAQKSVLDTVNLFYAAIMEYILNAWITQKKTIKDSGYLLKDAERYCGRNVKRVLKDFPNNLKKYQ